MPQWKTCYEPKRHPKFMSGKAPHSEHQQGLVVITGICGKIKFLVTNLSTFGFKCNQITPKHQPTVPFRKVYCTTKCHEKVYLQLFVKSF